MEIIAGPQSPVEQGVRSGQKKEKNIPLKVPASYLQKKKYLSVIYQGIIQTYSRFRITHEEEKSKGDSMLSKT